MRAAPHIISEIQEGKLFYLSIMDALYSISTLLTAVRATFSVRMRKQHGSPSQCISGPGKLLNNGTLQSWNDTIAKCSFCQPASFQSDPFSILALPNMMIK